MTLADLLRGRMGREAGDAGLLLAGMSAGAGPLQRDHRDLTTPLQNFGPAGPGESEWFRNLPPHRRRDFGRDWPTSPWQPVEPDPNATGRTINPLAPPYQHFWPWMAPGQQPRGAPRPRGRA